MNIKNAGDFKHRIKIIKEKLGKDADGFKTVPSTELVLETWAEVKTTKGFTLITNGTDFEKAFTRFTIRYPLTPIDRDMIILYGGKSYTIEYLNNVDEAHVLLEIQAKEVLH